MSAPLETDHGRAYAVWVVGIAVYFVAVFHRSSMAVAGLAASERFDISASQLATFTMLQLLVYASMQIPVGLVLDRFGSRRVLLAGLTVLTIAQTGFALSETYPAALVSRFFVGLGDAMVFICVLRLVTTWFSSRRVPFISQVTGVTGQLGAIVAAIPMTYALSHLGWTTSYLLAAAVGLAMIPVLLLVVHDTPQERSLSGPALSLVQVRTTLGEAWAHPGTRLGFWTHFATQFSATTLGLLWGYPFFRRGEGLTTGQAGFLLTLLVVAVMAAGPVLGWITAQHPFHRSTVVLSVIVAIVVMWTIVLAWPGSAPFWLLVVLVVVVGIGGPTSMIGFDFGRTSNPAHRQGSATGIINQAGFFASLTLVVAIGIILDWRTPGGGSDYTPEAFRWAMSAQYVLWALGLVQIVRYRILTRARLRADDPEGYARMAGLA